LRHNIPWVTYVHPNVRELEKAQALNDAEKLADARQVLIHALTTSRQSPLNRELRDLLGELNTRLFFSENNSPRKMEYTVARGDALASIARKLKSSTDVIMRVNQLESNLIRPGEKLLVPQLDFTITIDLPRDRVVVHDGHGFFTQYPIAAADLPPSRVSRVETKVTAKSFLKDGRPVAKSRAVVTDATPWIVLHQHGYILYGVEEASEESDARIEVDGDDSSASSDVADKDRPPQGIAMLKKDIAELDLLIRKGTPVTIILDQK
jgi:LysM repeat protein